MDFSTALSTLNTELGDSDNFALTAAEKTRALTRAWNDTYVVEETWDTSLTYDNTTQQYTLPTGVNAVISLGQDPDADSFSAEIPKDGFNIIAGKIHVLDSFRQLLDHNKTLYLHGWKKLTTSDSITDADLQEYVLMLAQHYCNNLLMNKKTFKFLKNDTTMAELVARNNQLREEVREYRRQRRVIPQEM